MTTQQTEWQEYTGSDEQLAELQGSKVNLLIRYSDNSEVNWNKSILDIDNHGVFKDATQYWIIPADPLREDKIRYAMTGQPVYWRSKSNGTTGICLDNGVSIPHAFYAPDHYEYSFTEFED